MGPRDCLGGVIVGLLIMHAREGPAFLGRLENKRGKGCFWIVEGARYEEQAMREESKSASSRVLRKPDYAATQGEPVLSGSVW